MADTGDNQVLAKMKVQELKKLLKSKGLATSGNKSELVERLLQADGNQVLGADGGEDVEDINDDSVLDEEDDLELEAVKGTEPLTEEKENTELIGLESAEKCIVKNEDVTKTVFKAKVITVGTTDAETDKLKSRADRFGVQSEDVKKKSRAERFGVASAEPAKLKRAERFGLTDTTSTVKSGGSPTAILSGADPEKLKKRAERFGVAVSSEFAEVKDVDALKKRAERFGQVTSTTLSKIDADEKIQKRKERFGQNTDTSDEQAKKKLRQERFTSK